jgi:hypothetical protein
MRRFILFIAVVLGAVAAVQASGQTDRAAVRGVCNTKGMDIYFWPQGHPAIPAIGFPAFAPAHAEFYKPRDLSNTGQLTYMAADSPNGLISTNQCSAVADKAMAFVSGATLQTTTSAQKLRCTFTANADLRIGPLNKTTSRAVTRIVKVRGKKKKVRRTIKTTVRIGNIASLGVSETAGAVVEMKLSTAASTISSLKWDTRSCSAIDVAG